MTVHIVSDRKVTAPWVVYGAAPDSPAIETYGWSRAMPLALTLMDLAKKQGWTEVRMEKDGELDRPRTPKDVEEDAVFVPFEFDPAARQDRVQALRKPPRIGRINQEKRAALCRDILKGKPFAQHELAALYLAAGYEVLARALRDARPEAAQKHAQTVLEL